MIGESANRPLSLVKGVLVALAMVFSATPGQAGGPATDPWQASQLIQPEDLAKALGLPAGERPVVLYVGFQVLYQGGHIVGSRYTGPASKDGAQGLVRALQGIPRDRKVVLYCGCCPWTDCPNIRPAFSTAQKAGFKHVQVLVLPKSFQQDWIAKGFPIGTGGTAE
jgi:hypothetical protein